MKKERFVNVITAISFLDLFAVGLIFPLLYPHIRTLGASHITVGLLGTTYSSLQVLSGPIIGSWSDLRGRKPVLVITLFLSSACYFLLGTTSSVYAIFLFRFALGFVKHTQTLCKAVIADLLPKEQQLAVFGRCSALSSVGFVVGPLLGGYLSEYTNGFFYVCSLTSVLFILNIALVYYIPNELISKKKRNSSKYIFSVRKEFHKVVSDVGKINWKMYWDVFALRFLYGLAISIYFSNQSLYIQEKYKLSQRFIGYTISYLSAIGVFSAFLLNYIGRLLYKNDSTGIQRINHAFIMITVSIISLYFAPSISIFLVILIPFSLSSSVLRIVSMQVIMNRCSEGRGSLAGASNSLMSVARFISPLSSGIISDIFGETTVLLFAFVPSVIGTILSFRLSYNRTVIKTHTQ